MSSFDPDAYLAKKKAFDPDAYLGASKENQEPIGNRIDPASAAILKGAQGVTGGYLDELSGAIEGIGSLINVRGLGGPTGNISWGDDRTFDQASQEGAERKRAMLNSAQQSAPALSTVSEFGGGMVAGAVAPLGKAASTLGKIGQSALLGGAAGAGYADGDLQDRIEGAATGATFGAAFPAALIGGGKAANKAVELAPTAAKKAGRILTTMPEELTERYINRGPIMDRTDSLARVAEDLPNDLGKLSKDLQRQSFESRKILDQEGVKVPTGDLRRRLLDLIKKADPNNESTSPVIKKLQEFLNRYEPKAGKIETSGSGSIISTPGKRPPSNIEGGEVKSLVQDLGETIDKIKVDNPAFKKSKGAILADEAYGNIQQPLKEASPAYAAKMQEISDKMKVLTPARKSFANKQQNINLLRRIGAEKESATFQKRDLDNLEGLIGADYNNRIKDQITLDAFTKPGVQGSRSVNAGRAAGGTVGGPVGESIGAAIGGTVDYYGRRLLKGSIDISRRIPSMPPKYKQSFQNAAQKGANGLAVNHHLLYNRDPEYRKMMDEMDAQENQ